MQELIAEQIPRLRRYARALLRNPVAADDLVQDTLERAWSRRALWRTGSDLRAWMFTIMHNVYVNQLRQRNAMPPVLSLEDEAGEIAVRGDEEDGLTLRDLDAALAHLHPDMRAVVLLVGLEQMQYEEVAAVLQIPIGTVMSRLSRGRERLRVAMAGEQPALWRVK